MTGLTDLTLLLNNACNLRCRYCHFVEPRPERQQVATAQRVHKAVRLFFAHAAERPAQQRVLCFNADGEALQSAEVLFGALELASSLRRDLAGGVILALVTNATLLDPEAAATLGRLGVSVTVSLDGGAEAHDAHRRDVGGGPTHQRAMRGIALLKEAKVPFSVRAVVTPQTSARLGESFGFLRALGPSRPVKLRPVRQPGPPFYPAPWAEQFADAYLSCVRGLLEAKVAVEQLPDDAQHFARFLVEGTGRGPYCPAGHSMLWMLPDGRLAPCGLMTHEAVCGHIDAVADGTALAALVEAAASVQVRGCSPARREPCTSCRWLPACGGGCPALALNGPPPLCGFYRSLGECLEEGLRR